jgi:hypothetical protein
VEPSEVRPLDAIRAISAFTGGSSAAAMLTCRAVLNSWNGETFWIYGLPLSEKVSPHFG